MSFLLFLFWKREEINFISNSFANKTRTCKKKMFHLIYLKRKLIPDKKISQSLLCYFLGCHKLYFIVAASILNRKQSC